MPDFRQTARARNAAQRDRNRWSTWRQRNRRASRLVNWVASIDSPVISGSYVKGASTTSSWYDSNIGISNVSTDTGKYYLEALIEECPAVGNNGIGVKNTSQLASANGANSLQIVWSQVGPQYYIWTDLAGSGQKTPISPSEATTQPKAGDVIGLAIDCPNGKMYAHVNGNWLEDALAGGDPSLNGGWTITNPANAVYLYGFTNSSGAFAFRAQDGAVSPYLPAGYTSLT